MSVHTPGPWTVDDDNNVRAGAATVALTYRNNIGMSVREELANAALVAAAPELFEALKAALQRCQACGTCGPAMCPECKQAIEVIRKAEGRRP